MQELLEAFKSAKAAYEAALAKGTGAQIPAARNDLQSALTACTTYQTKHKKDARSKDDRAKFVQSEELAMGLRLMTDKLDEVAALYTRLEGLDPAALAGNEADALKQLGWLDAIARSDADGPLKTAAKVKHAQLIGYMMAHAEDKGRVVAMAGPEMQAAYDRQLALGPLENTVKASTKRADHASTQIQSPVNTEHVDQAMRLSERLINPQGEVDMAAFWAFDPDTLPKDTSVGREMVKRIKRLRDNPEAQVVLENIKAPDPTGPAAKMVRSSLGLPANADVSAAQTRQAVLAAYMAELRQKDVGSCFATQVAIDQQNSHPERFMKDMADLMETGVLVRTVDGERIETPLETRMSDAALEDKTLSFGKGTPPMLTGAGRTRLDAPVGLEEAPAFKSAMGALGIDPAQNKAKMDAAMNALMLAENIKALEKAATKITDAPARKAVLALALPNVTADPATVKTALATAMANPGGGLTAVADPDLGQVTTDCDTAANAALDVTPAAVVKQLTMSELGITEADLKAAERYRTLEKEIKMDARMARVDENGP